MSSMDRYAQGANIRKGYDLIESDFRGVIVKGVRIDDFMKMIVDYTNGKPRMLDNIREVIKQLENKSYDEKMFIHCTEHSEDVKLFILFNRVFGMSLKEYKELTDDEIYFLDICVEEKNRKQFKPKIYGPEHVKISDADIKLLKDSAEAANISINFSAINESADVQKVADRIREILEKQISLSAKGAI